MKKILMILFVCLLLIPLSGFDDGPYVWEEEGKLVRLMISEGELIRDTLIADEAGRYFINWQDSGSRQIELLREYDQPVTFYEKPETYLVISDIHGNYRGLVDLLKAGGVIDESFNWQYEGYLVIDGDVFDRGEEATECMWLLYDLWQQSENNKQGKVLLILGNHETMVLSEKKHRVKGKYAEVCELTGKTYNELYSNTSILGRWLRHWNSVIKLGDTVILHGGISGGTVERFKALESINELLYGYYTTEQVKGEDLAYLLGRNGIFWYRGYFYDEDKWELSSPEVLKTIREQYKAELIIVGHTTLDSISYVQDGQVIGIDAGLKYQESGTGLLYRDKKYFILASDGERQELRP